MKKQSWLAETAILYSKVAPLLAIVLYVLNLWANAKIADAAKALFPRNEAKMLQKQIEEMQVRVDALTERAMSRDGFGGIRKK